MGDVGGVAAGKVGWFGWLVRACEASGGVVGRRFGRVRSGVGGLGGWCGQLSSVVGDVTGLGKTSSQVGR